MGFVNSPAFFQRKMDQLFSRYRWQSAIPYMDDLIIWSSSIEEHLQHIENALSIFASHNLTLAPEKGHVAYTQIEVLGHKVGRLGLATVSEKIDAMRRLPLPRTVGELESSLSLFGYYRQFIPSFSQIAYPLHQLRAKAREGSSIVFKDAQPQEGQVHWNQHSRKSLDALWTADCTEAYEHLKRRLCSTAVLAAPQFDQPFILYTDASYRGFGVALHQKDPQTGKERPVLFLSRNLRKEEKNYAPTELECGAVVWALRRLQHFVDGADVHVFTDHQALQWILSYKDAVKNNDRLMRWSLELRRYGDKLKITHRPGNRHGNVDALSRLIAPSLSPDHPLDDLEGEVFITIDVSEVWSLHYERDRTWKRLWVALGNNKSKNHFLRLDDRLYLVDTTSGLRRLCLPAAKTTQYIVFAHEQLAHGGVDKTYRRLHRDVYHPRLLTLVKDTLAQCGSCALNRIPTMNRTELQPIPTAATPFRIIGIDWVTGLPPCRSIYFKETFDAFMTVVDTFTKTVVLVPCCKTDSAQVSAQRFFYFVHRHHGLPDTIISDRDPRFTSSFWQSLCELTGVRQAMSTAYHPQTDGQSEKTNQVVEVALRHYIDEFAGLLWVDALVEVEFAINSARSWATAQTPFSLLYGAEVRDGLTTAAEGRVARAHLEVEDKDARTFQALRWRRRSEAFDSILFAQVRMSLYHDDSANPLPVFQPGDRVMLRTKDFLRFKDPDFPRKLGPQFVGPFTVLAKVGKLAYRLSLPPSWQLHPVINVTKLARAPSDDSQMPRLTNLMPIPLQIEAERRVDNRLQYLIRYSDDVIWEDADLVSQSSPDLVANWHPPSQPTIS